MDSIKASSHPAIATPTKKALAFSSNTPIKGKSPVPSDDQFWTPTPEKPAQRSRRGCGSSIAFSVNEVRQAALGLCKKDGGINEKLDRDLALVEKQLRSKKAVKLSSSKEKDEIQLPHKYQILCEIFNCMECSIRLLRLRGSMPTFSNLYARIQDLANQNLTYKQLAQIKHILPEAIIIKKVLLRDESTCCMKPELQISMNAEGIGINTKEEGQTAYLHLRKVFKERLVDFVRDHPEEGDIPEDELPHPFNHSNKPSSTPKIIKENTSVDEPQSVVLSHMPPSFQRRFSQKATVSALRNPLFDPSSTNSPNTCTSASEATPVKKCISSLQATPAKLVSTPARLMASTPAINTPKRCLSESSVNLPPVKRSETKRLARPLLFTSPNKCIKEKEKQGEEVLVETIEEDGVLDFLPKSLLQSVKEKERRVLLEKETGVADAIRRQRMIGCLPSTFNTILLSYRSLNRSVMTKQELIHKIIANNSKIVDREEVEEQLSLLQEIIPDWISEKTALGGDVLLRVNMLCSPEEIRERLAKAE
ncbi:CDT1-like protein a [Carex littledalei]|uniref:CDT1-like protein a n=1 Tax=Carex littledalei TaxID=544730 RepID=A0A833QNK7_9POAL|nr:CDT1-like protein a [Carex littledalei]